VLLGALNGILDITCADAVPPRRRSSAMSHAVRTSQGRVFDPAAVAANRALNASSSCHAGAVAPNLSLLLDRLQSRQLLRRERSTSDGARRSSCSPTPAARGAGQRAAAGPMEAALLDRLTPAERLMLIELLRKVAGR